jgi:hypothetical protein
MLRSPNRWMTPFASWVSKHSVSKLRDDLATQGHSVSTAAIYAWLAGRAAPRLPCALRIAQLSGGAVTVEDIAQHRALIERTTRTRP